MKDNQKDNQPNQDTGKNKNTGTDNAPQGQDITNKNTKQGAEGGLKPSQTDPKTGGRQGGGSVEDGGQDMGSSAGSR